MEQPELTVIVPAGSRLAAPPSAVRLEPGHGGGNAALACNLAALRAETPRLLLVAGPSGLRLDAEIAARPGVFAIGPFGRGLRRGVAGAQRALRGVLGVVALGLPRELYLRAGGLNEALGAESDGLSAPLTELVLRLLHDGVRVDALDAPAGRAPVARGELGLAAGRVLRHVRGRMDIGTAAAAGLGVAIAAAGPALLKRAGFPLRVGLTGHDLVGLAAGLRESPPPDSGPPPPALEPDAHALLAEQGIVELVLEGPWTPRRCTYRGVDRDGIARLALRIDHAPGDGQLERLGAREDWRRERAAHLEWIPRLWTAGRLPGGGMYAIESLHVPLGAADAGLRRAEALRWLVERRPLTAGSFAGGRHAAALSAQAREAGSTPLGMRLSAALTALESVPAPPEHGDLRAEQVVVSTGRSVLTGWEHFAELGLPGFDALALALSDLDPAAAREAIAALAHGAQRRLFEPWHDELAALGVGDRAGELVTCALATLAERERQRALRLEPGTPRHFGELLERWLRDTAPRPERAARAAAS